jgi:hypothetical protein
MGQPVQIVERPLGSGLQRFLDVPRALYRGDPCWVAPLDRELERRLDPARGPFFCHGEATSFLAVRGGRDLGRITAQIDRQHLKRYDDQTGFFGFLDTGDDAGVAQALLDAAAAWLRGRGMARMRGPLSLSIRDEVGCLVEGFDAPPLIGMPWHQPHQGRLIESAGLSKERDVLAWRCQVGQLDPGVYRALEATLARPELTLRHARPERLEEDLRTIQDVFSDACDDQWGTVEATEEELAAAVRAQAALGEPRLAALAELGGLAVAAGLGLPDHNEALRGHRGRPTLPGRLQLWLRRQLLRPRSARFLLIGIRRDYRRDERLAVLALAMLGLVDRSAARLGIRWYEMSWTDEHNRAVTAFLQRAGARVYKRYRVYSRAL